MEEHGISAEDKTVDVDPAQEEDTAGEGGDVEERTRAPPQHTDWRDDCLPGYCYNCEKTKAMASVLEGMRGPLRAIAARNSS